MCSDHWRHALIRTNLIDINYHPSFNCDILISCPGTEDKVSGVQPRTYWGDTSELKGRFWSDDVVFGDYKHWYWLCNSARKSIIKILMGTSMSSSLLPKQQIIKSDSQEEPKHSTSHRIWGYLLRLNGTFLIALVIMWIEVPEHAPINAAVRPILLVFLY